MRNCGSTRPGDSETRAVPNLAPTQGQTLLLLSELGFREGVSMSTFDYYLDSLQKLGVPFEFGKGQSDGILASHLLRIVDARVAEKSNPTP